LSDNKDNFWSDPINISLPLLEYETTDVSTRRTLSGGRMHLKSGFATFVLTFLADFSCPSLDDFLEVKNVVNVFRGDGNFLKARQEAKKGELDEQLRQVNTHRSEIFSIFAKIRNFAQSSKQLHFRENHLTLSVYAKVFAKINKKIAKNRKFLSSCLGFLLLSSHILAN
jgi:hypothetical protein